MDNTLYDTVADYTFYVRVSYAHTSSTPAGNFWYEFGGATPKLYTFKVQCGINSGSVSIGAYSPSTLGDTQAVDVSDNAGP